MLKEGKEIAGVSPETAGTLIIAEPQIGGWYYSPGPVIGEAEEKREVVAINETLETPLGTFSGCVKQKLTGWGHPE